MSRKIFCIGLNKTGTSTLHKAFEILGLKSVHYMDDKGNNIKEIITSNFLAGNNILKGIDKYEVFSDWDQAPNTIAIFKEFDRQYPNSKFIANTRELQSWLDSRESHVKRNQEKKLKNPELDVKWLKIDRQAWENQYKSHYSEIKTYFENREKDLLVFDVVEGDGWEKLCHFLDLPIPNIPFPRKNFAPEKRLILNEILARFEKQIQMTKNKNQ
jgi:hypothetical protein